MSRYKRFPSTIPFTEPHQRNYKKNVTHFGRRVLIKIETILREIKVGLVRVKTKICTVMFLTTVSLTV